MATVGTVGTLGNWRWDEPVELLLRVLDRGGVIGFPTGSSYALGVDPRSAAGVDEIYRLKRRQRGKPLPVVVASVADFGDLDIEVAADGWGGLINGWPGPLSLVVPCGRDWPAAAGSGSLAVRVPGHERLRHLLARLGRPLTATSANSAGRDPIVDPAELRVFLQSAEAVVIDDGVLPARAASTVVALDGDRARVLRWGRISARRLQELAPGLDWLEPFSATSVEIPVEESS